MRPQGPGPSQSPTLPPPRPSPRSLYPTPVPVRVPYLPPGPGPSTLPRLNTPSPVPLPYLAPVPRPQSPYPTPVPRPRSLHRLIPRSHYHIPVPRPRSSLPYPRPVPSPATLPYPRPVPGPTTLPYPRPVPDPGPPHPTLPPSLPPGSLPYPRPALGPGSSYPAPALSPSPSPSPAPARPQTPYPTPPPTPVPARSPNRHQLRRSDAGPRRPPQQTLRAPRRSPRVLPPAQRVRLAPDRGLRGRSLCPGPDPHASALSHGPPARRHLRVPVLLEAPAGHRHPRGSPGALPGPASPHVPGSTASVRTRDVRRSERCYPHTFWSRLVPFLSRSLSQRHREPLNRHGTPEQTRNPAKHRKEIPSLEFHTGPRDSKTSAKLSSWSHNMRKK